MKDENLDSTSFGSSAKRARKLNGAGMFFLFTTILLLGAGIFISADYAKKSKQANILTTELSASDKRYTELDARYTVALADIESYRGKNATLDSLISMKEKSLLDMKANLNRERKQRQLGEKEYKAQLTDLNSLITDLTGKIESLQKANGVLIVQKDSLGNDIYQKQTVISQLETTNSSLSQKVTVASLLIPTHIAAEGIHDKSNGKVTETNRASKAQHLRVCFDVPQNKVAETGSKTFFIRILNPDGSVLAIDNQGSGIFTSIETGAEIQYSTSLTADYQQQAQTGLCTVWNQGTPFQEGNYTAEIYQDGYLTGKQMFELK
jgi:hypothetical protein